MWNSYTGKQSRIRRCHWVAGVTWVTWVMWLTLCCAAQPAAAQPVPRVHDAEVPPALAPWLPWALGDAPELLCPTRDGAPLCLWPSSLSLDLSEQGGEFEVEVWLDHAGLVPLPGAGASWPLDVAADGRAVPVVAHADRPSTELPVGRHHLQGRFRWPRLPETLSLPPQYAQVRLRVRDKSVQQPKRDAAGSLWLQAKAPAEEQPQLELRVTRALRDGVPPQLDTQLLVRVAGAAREVDLGNVLPADNVPLSVDAELPARLDATGHLRLQVRAGSFEVRIRSRFLDMPDSITSERRDAPWPAQEAWVFESDVRLRQVELSGVHAVDSAQVELDEAFRGLPTFLVKQGDVLQLKTVRRGDPEPVPDDLRLQRTLWLDQDGHGYSVQDNLSGQLHTTTRLDLRPFALGRVAVSGQDQLITRTSPDAPTGVELRDTTLSLQADYHIEHAGGELPAVGWSSHVRALQIALNLPPGYELLAASGVDSVDHSWLSAWNLFGFFYVLIVSLGAAKVAGRRFGVIAFVALAVSYQEPDAPKLVWLALIACVALLQHLQGPTAQRIARAAAGFTLLVLILQGLPFAVRSVREALYPQLALELYTGASVVPLSTAITMEEAPAAPKRKAAASRVAMESLEEPLEDSDSAGGYAADKPAAPEAAKARLTPTDPDAVVQTGPGLPNWNWRSYLLSWSGPVQRDHRLSLWIAPPWLTRAAAVLRVLLLALLALGLVRAAPRWRRDPAGPAVAAGGATMLLVLLWGASAARADFPDKTLLDELRARVVRAPECRPNCVTISQLSLRVDADVLSMEAVVHALDASSVRLPGPAATWTPQRVQLDGADAPLRLHEDGFVHARVSPGVHRVHISGRLPPQDALTLRLGDRPAQVQLQADGYEVQGVREDGSAADSIELRRLLKADTEAQDDAETPLPAWLTITRELELGYTFQAHTSVRRVTPLGSAVVLHLPLLAGESVHDSRVQLHNAEAIVSLGPDDAELSFASSLTPREAIELVAASMERYSEIWQVRCGASWQCDYKGLAPISREQGGHALMLFRPWPKERLHIGLHKPTPAEGRTLTFDAASYAVTPGIRQSDATLSLRVRASRSASPTLTLPEGARVRSLSVNQQPRPVHSTGRSLPLGLQPGAADVSLDLEYPSGMERVYTVPPLSLDAPITNARLTVTAPPDSWLLWVSGPAWGPAILFWGYLLLCLMLAWGLGRARGIPLRRHQWLLLAAGLTQVDAVEAVIVVGFFFAFAWRQRATDLKPLWHDLMQVSLALLTFIAASALFDAVRHGLLVQPDMQVAGLGSSANQLMWYIDRTSGALPSATLVTLPLWVYRGLMLLWALWLASRLLEWVPWAFAAFTSGDVWKRRKKNPPTAAAQDAPAPPSSSEGRLPGSE